MAQAAEEQSLVDYLKSLKGSGVILPLDQYNFLISR